MYPWQRQPGEAPADFTAFVSYLRLKGRRSHRAVAAQTGRSLGAIRRLSAKSNWPSRVAAFEARLADASQDALDLLVRATSTCTAADSERLREAEFQLAQRVLHEARRWLQLASDPHRRKVALGQVCRVMDLATRLGRLAAGMPTGEEPRRRPGREDAPGYWTGPSVEEALEKIYGSASSANSPPPEAKPRHSRPSSDAESAGKAPPLADSPASNGTALSATTSVELCPAVSLPSATSSLAPSGIPSLDVGRSMLDVGCSPASSSYSHSDSSHVNPACCTAPPPPAKPTPCVAPEPRRRDAWAAWARSQRQTAAIRPG